MIAELSKKQLSDAKRDALVFINAIKSNMKDLMKTLRSTSTWVYRSAQSFYECRDQFALKDTDKNKKRFNRAEESYSFASSEYAHTLEKINNNLTLIESEYAKLIDTCRAQGDVRGAEGAKRDLDGYVLTLRAMMLKNDKSDGTALPPREKEADSTEAVPVEQEKAEAKTSEPVKAGISSVEVAPMTIDVTPIIESAISSVMERLNDSLTKRIDEYVGSLDFGVTGTTTPAQEGESEGAEKKESVQTLTPPAEELVAAEAHILDKLKAMCESAATLLQELATISDAYREIADKQKALADMQKQINELQRHTAREQDGVQVNQKLIAKEQAEVSATQSTLLAEQRSISEQQRAVAEAQSAVDESLSEIVKVERELAAKQRAIAEAGDGIIAMVDKISEKQSEIQVTQKETLSASRKLHRDQKQLLVKLREKDTEVSDRT